MANASEGEAPLAEEPRRSSTWTILILMVVIVACGKRKTMAPTMEDLNDLRQIAGVLLTSDAPLAPHGRIDVYPLVRKSEGDGERERILRICHSSRSDKGPTWPEIEAGDYRNFPYQRYRGVPNRGSLVRVPLVWDRVSGDGEARVAGFSDGSATFEEEATFQEFFRSNPGQE